MCAINGILQQGAGDPARLSETVARLRDTMVHRGPDAAGYWGDAAAGVGLGHRRLSILDLSPAGSQPMQSACGRFVMVFNGEVYNYLELRSELEAAGLAPRWRGHSDTELMLAAIAGWGVDKAVSRFNGMFAFAVWDRDRRVLTLVRDRAGVKPLYLGRAGGSLVFASELRGVAAHPEFRHELDREALPSYLAHGYFPAPRSVYRDAMQSGPGTILEVEQARWAEFDWTGLRNAAWGHRHLPFEHQGVGWRYRTYWTAREVWINARRNRFTGDFAEALDEIDRLVRDSVRLRMLSDVPLGTFLSGGVDSALVTGAMQAGSAKPVRTFTIGFEDEKFDESPVARAVAAHLGTDHTEYRTSEKDALEVALRLGELLDEPLADSSFIPTYLVSKLTRRQVTVALTGDGGDEAFGGYYRYWVFRPLKVARQCLARLAGPVGTLAAALDVHPQPRGRLAWYRYRAARVLRLVAAPDFQTAYVDAMTAQSRLPLLRGGMNLPQTYANEPSTTELPDLTDRMMEIDFANVLPDDLLVKVDRASMAVSLESREPLLDYRLVEFAARLPVSFKVGGNQGKLVLRRLLARYVPREVIDQPKRGFAVPLESWLKTSLRPWAEDLMAPARLAREGIFAPNVLPAAWADHQASRADHKALLWNSLVLLNWLRHHEWD